MARWQIPGRVNVVGSVTVFRSEYRNDRQAPWIASAWDNRFVVNVSGTYDLPRHWSFGAKLSAVGGAPYTPYDVERSSLVEALGCAGTAVYDYSKYNAGGSTPSPAGRARRQGVLLPPLHAGRLHRPAKRCGRSFAPARRADVHGEIENPSAPASERRYRMKYLEQVSGTLLPTLGLTIEF